MEPELPEVSNNRWDSLIELDPRQLVQIALVGAVTGAVVWLLTLLIRQVVFVPLFCGDPMSSGCTGASGTASIIAGIIGAVIGLMGLVRISVYRPLLIVLAAMVALWGFGSWLSDNPWYQAMTWSVILYALTYAAFAWLVRPRIFGIALGTVVVVIILARWFAVL